MAEVLEQPVLGFLRYPGLGEEDWRYAYATAVVRALEPSMLSRAALRDMAGAESFEAAMELLASNEYSMGQGLKNLSEIERLLGNLRTAVRELFEELMIDEEPVKLLKARVDFANLHLSLKRKLTDREVGADYIEGGSVSAAEFSEVIDQEDYSRFAYHMQEAIEAAVIAYYQDKEIRQIDYALDIYEAEYKVRQAQLLEDEFLLELFRMQIDLTNIRTMLRLKFTESEQRKVFLTGGYVEYDRLRHGLDVGYEAMAGLFFATPYHDVVESGASYLVSKKSFLRLEANCDRHVVEFLKSTEQITAGPQPVIAYLLMKEHEIRMVRMILTAKKNGLDTRLIVDRLGE